MKSVILCCVLIAGNLVLAQAQEVKPQPQRIIQIKLKTGEMLTGNLVAVDVVSIDFTVKGILQTVSVEDVESILFVKSLAPVALPVVEVSSSNGIMHMSEGLRPTITYKETASYTADARNKGVEGSIVLNVVFTADGKITNIRVVRGLPEGLTDEAIKAAQKIRFIPAMRNGKPVSVRGNLEFAFSLYGLEAPILITPEHNQIFHHDPRKVQLKWLPMRQAARYIVRIDAGDQQAENWTLWKEVEMTEATYTFDFLGAQPGRWRVIAIDARGKYGMPSGWRVFRFTK